MPRSRGLRSPRGFQGGHRRESSWGLGPGSSTLTSISTTTPAFLGSAIVPLDLGMTIVRIRGYLRVVLRSAAALGDNLTGAMGIGIATFAAVTAGIGSVPTPITEQDSDNWLYWTPVQVGSMATTAQWGSAGWALFETEVDTKAMRKFPDEMAIYAAIELATEVGTVTVNAFFDSRALLLLS